LHLSREIPVSKLAFQISNLHRCIEGWRHRELALSDENAVILESENAIRKVLAAAPEVPPNAFANPAGGAVGLYKLNPVDPQLETACFRPLSL
jgi:hypothetical protein